MPVSVCAPFCVLRGQGVDHSSHTKIHILGMFLGSHINPCPTPHGRYACVFVRPTVKTSSNLPRVLAQFRVGLNIALYLICTDASGFSKFVQLAVLLAACSMIVSSRFSVRLLYKT